VPGLPKGARVEVQPVALDGDGPGAPAAAKDPDYCWAGAYTRPLAAST